MCGDAVCSACIVRSADLREHVVAQGDGITEWVWGTLSDLRASDVFAASADRGAGVGTGYLLPLPGIVV